MQLRDWIIGEHAAVLDRFEQSITTVVPLDRWTDPVGAGGSSIAWLAFHIAYHEDLAVQAVLRGTPTVAAEHRSALGLDAFAPATGLGEAEQPDLVAALDLDALLPYVRAVHAATASHVATLDTTMLGSPANGSAGLQAEGVTEDAVPWLYRMWDGKPVSWFVQWEAIGHRVNHVGEMVSVRNRLGLSPF